MNKLIPGITLVTNKNSDPLDEYLKFIITCAQAGIDSVQLREKNLSYEELLEFENELGKVLKPYNIPLIVNDDVNLAYKLNAAGVHLGQDDGNVLEARALLGEDKIIGVTIDSIDQLYIANQQPIDYVGIGAIFPTKNKINIAKIWGCDGLAQLLSISNKPIIAIGGIDESNIAQVVRAGVKNIAAIGAFHNSNDPSNTILTFKNYLA